MFHEEIFLVRILQKEKVSHRQEPLLMQVAAGIPQFVHNFF
jgi:hypothetical protein